MKANLAGSALRFIPAFFLALAPVVPAWGQQTAPQVLRNPVVNSAVHFDISPPLSQMAIEFGPQQGLHLASPVLYPKAGLLTKQPQGPFEDPALQKSIGPLVPATIGLNLLGVGKGFQNYAVPDAPTDVNLAVGDTQVVQWVNVSYAVFDKTTGAVVAGPIAGNQFWSGFGGPCQSNNSGDIIPQWDKIAHRWVMFQNVFTSPYTSCFAVSTTPDATGTYYRFSFPQSAGFPDYPKLGIMPDAYYQSNNIFNASGTAYLGAGPCAYERAKMLTGDSTAKQICFLTGTFDDSLLPADLDSAANLPPTGQPEVFLGSIDNGTAAVYEYLFHVDFATPSNSTLTGVGGSMPISGVASFSLACGGGTCIPQKGVSDQLGSLGDRLMYRLAYRNFGDHQTWLVSHSVTAGSSVGMRWYEFHAPETSTTFTVYQQSTWAPDSNYRWMGSIAMDKAQDIALGYSVSSSSVYPSITYTGRVPGDPAGTMESEATIVSGTGSQTGTANRWGDYTSMALDAADDCTFWYTNQYYTATASFGWSTRLASFKFNNCGSSSPDFSLSASPTSLSLGQNTQGASTITVTSLNSFSSPVTFTTPVVGCPSGASCTFGSNPVTPAPNGTTTSQLTVNAGTAAAGTYTLTITGTSGSTSHSTTVTLTVAAPDFSLSASPTSLSLGQNAQGTSTITVAPVNGFTGSVTLSCSGQPTGVSCGFNPNPTRTNSTLTVTTTTVASGTYTLTITGTSGTLTHTTTVSLTVTAPAPNFLISASPSSQSITRGQSANYTTTVTSVNGFNSPVTLSVTGLPSRASYSFSPNPDTPPANGYNTSILTVRTQNRTTRGTYTLTIKGVNGSLSQSTTVSLTVN